MTYYYDIYGWLSATPIEGRSTEVVPMQPEGNKQPNFTGYEWILLAYYPPIPLAPTAPTAPLPSAQQNAEQANAILAATDWTSIPAVGDPERSNPYLTNQSEWLYYRSNIRDIALNPPEGNVYWGTQPQELWSN